MCVRKNSIQSSFVYPPLSQTFLRSLVSSSSLPILSPLCVVTKSIIKNVYAIFGPQKASTLIPVPMFGMLAILTPHYFYCVYSWSNLQPCMYFIPLVSVVYPTKYDTLINKSHSSSLSVYGFIRGIHAITSLICSKPNLLALPSHHTFSDLRPGSSEQLMIYTRFHNFPHAFNSRVTKYLPLFFGVCSLHGIHRCSDCADGSALILPTKSLIHPPQCSVRTRTQIWLRLLVMQFLQSSLFLSPSFLRLSSNDLSRSSLIS